MDPPRTWYSWFDDLNKKENNLYRVYVVWDLNWRVIKPERMTWQGYFDFAKSKGFRLPSKDELNGILEAQGHFWQGGSKWTPVGLTFEERDFFKIDSGYVSYPNGWKEISPTQSTWAWFDDVSLRQEPSHVDQIIVIQDLKWKLLGPMSEDGLNWDKKLEKAIERGGRLPTT